jgi:hypothetical protein
MWYGQDMDTHNIPSGIAVRNAMSSLSMAQLERLAELSGVPWTTLYKIKLGKTRSPGIETVRKFMPFIEQAALPVPTASPVPAPVQ